METSFQHYNDIKDQHSAVRFFYLSLGLVRVCDIGNAELVCRNLFSSAHHKTSAFSSISHRLVVQSV